MEKIRLFIGSSVEGLDIAYAIQENLEFSAEVTIWDQGVFELTSTALDDLVITIENSDIGVFVFSPDDITKIRDIKYKTTRDNVIFELGLFLGYLGRNRVSFVIPRGIDKFHLPSDLTGITPGYFNPNRKDKNLRAALGPYCNQLKKIIENTSILKLSNFKDDNEIIKRIVINKPTNWEFLLTKEILKVELGKLNREVHEIKYDLYITKTQNYNIQEFLELCGDRARDFVQILTVFGNNFHMLIESWGEFQHTGDENEIKDTVLRMVSIGFRALEIEKLNKGIQVPEELSELKKYLSNWSFLITDSINIFYSKLQNNFKDGIELPEKFDLNINLKTPENIIEMTKKIEYYRNNPHILFGDK